MYLELEWAYSPITSEEEIPKIISETGKKEEKNDEIPNRTRMDLDALLSELKKNPKKIMNLKDFPSDGSMTEKEFREKYTTLLEKLWEDLQFSNTNGKALLLSIIHQETNFANKLKHPEGSTWVMQLTKWPFSDMKWETITKWVFDAKKVEKFQKIFQKIDIDKIKSIPFGDGNTIEQTLPQDIWEKIEKIGNPNTRPKDASQAIHELQQVEKGKRKDYYLHTLNMIIWSVYLKHVFETKGKNDVGKTAYFYNGNPALQKKYADNVVNYYKAENK